MIVFSEKPKIHNFKDLEGLKFGRLLVIGYIGVLNSKTYWMCRCDCGNEKAVPSSNLIIGSNSSCGCLAVESLKKRVTKYGGKNSGNPCYALYPTWSNILQRCKNPKNKSYPNYGGRGIKVCDRWLKFENFYADMGDRPSAGHSLDRIDNDGDYCPENCRWATQKEQCNNKRNNIKVLYMGQNMTLSEWGSKLGLSNQVIYNRQKLGWSIEDVLSRPKKKSKKDGVKVLKNT